MPFVYKYVLDGKPIYIGITGDADVYKRLRQHGRPGDNIVDRDGKLRKCKVYFCKVPTRNDAETFESILINKYKPEFNTAKNVSRDWVIYSGTHLVWKQAEYDKIWEPITPKVKPADLKPFRPKVQLADRNPSSSRISPAGSPSLATFSNNFEEARKNLIDPSVRLLGVKGLWNECMIAEYIVGGGFVDLMAVSVILCIVPLLPDMWPLINDKNASLSEYERRAMAVVKLAMEKLGLKIILYNDSISESSARRFLIEMIKDEERLRNLLDAAHEALKTLMRKHGEVFRNAPELLFEPMIHCIREKWNMPLEQKGATQ